MDNKLTGSMISTINSTTTKINLLLDKLLVLYHGKNSNDDSEKIDAMMKNYARLHNMSQCVIVLLILLMMITAALTGFVILMTFYYFNL